MAKRTYTRAQREEAFSLMVAGHTSIQVSAMLGIPRSTLTAWRREPTRGCFHEPGPPLGTKVIKAGRHEWRSIVGWAERYST
jgi:transposase-like protein